jgi:predicted Rossmann fold flavoprotein
LGPNEAARHFGDGANFVTAAMRAMSPQRVRDHFETLGVKTKEEPEFEKVFPASDSAVEVRDALLRDATESGAKIRLESQVIRVEKRGETWVVTLENSEVTCDRLLLCAGGKSYPKSGTTGDGYRWLRDLGLRIVDPVPALVPLTSADSWIHGLSGIAVDGELRIGKGRRKRPTLFTHKGLSGPAPMDLSEHVTRGGERDARLDLLPNMSVDELRQLLVSAAERPGSPRLASLIPLPRRLLEAVASRARLREVNPAANQINKGERNRLLECLKALPVPISGTLGFAKAEVTAGGLALDQVYRKTMEVKDHPGLFVFGELLDLTGPIGGFSFQAAFCTAELAANAACSGLRGER